MDLVHFAQFKEDRSSRFSIKEMDVLGRTIKKMEKEGGKKVVLVVLDPLTSFMDGADRNNNTEVRDALVNISNFLEHHKDISIIGITHVKKGGTFLESAMDIVCGASEFTNVARCGWMVFYDKRRDVRLILPAKWNLGKMPLGIEFQIESVNVEGLKTQYGKCVIKGDYYGGNADDYLEQLRYEKLYSGKDERLSAGDAKEILTDRVQEQYFYTRDELIDLGMDEVKRRNKQKQDDPNGDDREITISESTIAKGIKELLKEENLAVFNCRDKNGKKGDHYYRCDVLSADVETLKKELIEFIGDKEKEVWEVLEHFVPGCFQSDKQKSGKDCPFYGEYLIADILNAAEEVGLIMEDKGKKSPKTFYSIPKEVPVTGGNLTVY